MSICAERCHQVGHLYVPVVTKTSLTGARAVSDGVPPLVRPARRPSSGPVLSAGGQSHWDDRTTAGGRLPGGIAPSLIERAVARTRHWPSRGCRGRRSSVRQCCLLVVHPSLSSRPRPSDNSPLSTPTCQHSESTSAGKLPFAVRRHHPPVNIYSATIGAWSTFSSPSDIPLPRRLVAPLRDGDSAAVPSRLIVSCRTPPQSSCGTASQSCSRCCCCWC